MRHIIAILRGRKGVRWRDSICCEEWLVSDCVRWRRASGGGDGGVVCMLYLRWCTRRGRLCMIELVSRLDRVRVRRGRLELSLWPAHRQQARRSDGTKDRFTACDEVVAVLSCSAEADFMG